MNPWPVVGRENELRQVTTAVLDQRGALVSGPAGVGKTTLATAGAEAARDRGMSVVQTVVTRSVRALPFGAFASFPSTDPARSCLSGDGHSELFGHYVRALVDGAAGRPLMVFVDDAHLLDDGSAALVHQLALTGAATVIATVRSGETSPDAIAALWKEGPCERIEVGALDASVIEELLTLVLGALVDGGAPARAGRPLSRQPPVLAGASHRGGRSWDAREQAGHLVPSVPLEPSGRLGDLVALRLANLPRLERVVLELLSIGGPLGRATLEQLTDPGSVAELERKGLVTPRIDGRRAQLWLAQPVFGDGVRMRLSALREHALARSRAEVVESTGARRREDILLLASWRFKGGGGSAELLLAGATEARARRDYQLTRQLAGAAVVEGGGFRSQVPNGRGRQLPGPVRPGRARPGGPVRGRGQRRGAGLASPCSALTTATSSQAAPTLA